MIEVIKKILESNQLASAGILVLFTGASMGVLYKAQHYINRFLKYWLFTQINFSSEDANFLSIQNWLFKQSYTRKRCANLMVKNLRFSRDSEDIYENDRQKTLQIFVPSYGFHYFMIGWRPVILNYTRNEAKDIKHQEFINIQIFNIFNKLDFATKIVQEASDIYNKEEYEETSIFGCPERYSGWYRLLKKNIRQNPILSTPDEYNSIINHIQRFLDNKDWYVQKGINYKQGFLFAGVPGSGKTSCVLSLAQYFKRHIYILNLNDQNIDDAKFIELVTSLPKNSIFLIEDIDAISMNREVDNKKLSEQNKPVSLSTILNSLDGLLSPDGLLFFITTNYPEKLDEALVRPGRIDLIKQFSYANEYQVGAIYNRFLPDSNENDKKEFVTKYCGQSMATIESKLIEKII